MVAWSQLGIGAIMLWATIPIMLYLQPSAVTPNDRKSGLRNVRNYG